MVDHPVPARDRRRGSPARAGQWAHSGHRVKDAAHVGFREDAACLLHQVLHFRPWGVHRVGALLEIRIRSADQGQTIPGHGEEDAAVALREEHHGVMRERRHHQVDPARAPQTRRRLGSRQVDHLVRPGAGGIHHHARAQGVDLACRAVLHLGAAHPSGAEGERARERIVGEAGAAYLRRQQVLDAEPLGEIHLGVVVERAAAEAGFLQAGLHLAHLGGGEHPV